MEDLSACYPVAKIQVPADRVSVAAAVAVAVAAAVVVVVSSLGDSFGSV